MFCVIKVFRKEVVFVVDISGSMRGKPLEDTKNALFAALAKLDPKDLFNVIAFNGETYLFSSILEPATAEAIENAIQWINVNFVAGGGTNILLPLNQVFLILWILISFLFSPANKTCGAFSFWVWIEVKLCLLLNTIISGPSLLMMWTWFLIKHKCYFLWYCLYV